MEWGHSGGPWTPVHVLYTSVSAYVKAGVSNLIGLNNLYINRGGVAGALCGALSAFLQF